MYGLRVALLLLVVALGGCGSAMTVNRGDSADVRDMRLDKTYCTHIPRVYSGVVYNFCTLNGESGGAYQRDAQLPLPYTPLGYYVYWPLVDGVLSAATDTLVLPYTIFRQQRDGSIELTHGD